MESTKSLSSRFNGRALRQLAERVLDIVTQSAVVIVPAALFFAVYQFALGAAEAGLAGMIIAGFGALGIYARLIEPFRLRIKRLQIGIGEEEIRDWRLEARTQSPISNLQPGIPSPLTICFFADLHVGRFRRADWVRRVVALANAQKPDAVLIGGDFVGHLDQHLLADLLEPLCQLQAPLGVYAVLGNHDYGLPGPDHTPELMSLLRRLNVRLLRNECVTLAGRLQLIGLDELWANLDDADAAFGACEPAGDSQELPARRIVLGHNPDLMSKINQCADLFLFGHTHGGQIYIPFLTRYIVPVAGDLYRGLHELPQGKVYVTTGCGETTTPTRLGATPEVVVITVK